MCTFVLTSVNNDPRLCCCRVGVLLIRMAPGRMSLPGSVRVTSALRSRVLVQAYMSFDSSVGAHMCKPNCDVS